MIVQFALHEKSCCYAILGLTSYINAIGNFTM